jgi:hypothetical protein
VTTRPRPARSLVDEIGEVISEANGLLSSTPDPARRAMFMRRKAVLVDRVKSAGLVEAPSTPDAKDGAS